MNKNFSKVFMGFAALSLLAACSDDPVVDNSGVNGDNNGGTTGTDDQVYLKVNIKAVNPGRATTPENDKGYEYGIDDEHAVNDAQFFFFDENGVFVSKGSFWNDGNDGDKPNVEYFGNNVLVVDKSSQKGNPRFLLTVLNAPDFQPSSTLQATAESLELTYSNEIGEAKKMYFVMSTSSWFEKKADNKNHDNKFYYATRLDDSDFYLTPALATTANNQVDVYVERLAAKFEVNIKMNDNQAKIDLADGTTIYRVSNTVGGDDNDENVGIEDAANTAVYIKFLGWEVSATADKSFLSKQFGIGWDTTAPYTGWDKYADEDFRTFWAYSAPYSFGVDTDNGRLTYVAESAKLTKKFGDLSSVAATDYGKYVAYANENTNLASEAIVSNAAGRLTADNRKVTHIVLRAQACDATGNALSLVRYQGILYREKAFLAYLLNSIDMGTNKNLNFWVVDGVNAAGTTQYKQIDENYLTIESVNGGSELGAVKAVANLKSTDKIYRKGEKDEKVLYWEMGEDGQPKLDENGDKIPVIDDATGEQKFDIVKVDAYELYDDAATAINAALASKQGNSKAVSYNGGEMVYFVPIRHNVEDTSLEANDEGYYGVVRNHWYKIEINSVDKLGHGVFDPGTGTPGKPGEVLVPDDPEEEPLYYVGARINVLSWKVVNQGVDL